ncbi:MAG: FAD-dependent oxidoreductase [Gemmatimonadetes bacterium]|nr:FAD-dependent oxidoreductase [Gemmatimonadota bacterium]
MTLPSDGDTTIRIVGFPWSPAEHDVKDYLARSRTPYDWLDLETSDDGRRLVEELGVSRSELPLVIFPDGTYLLSPTNEDLAAKIGLRTEAGSPFYDMIVIGGGPAGLSAAVYGSSEGLRTIVVEREAPGGQAGMSSRIENYFGFPDGLSGGELAERAITQAGRFGVELVAARAATGLRVERPYRVVTLDDGSELYCRSVLLALGVSWRILEAPGCRELIGRGVYYGAASAEAPSCGSEDVYLIGAGNSSGQAAMLLARYARSVTLVAPETDFAERMSEYLLERLRGTENIRFRPKTVVTHAAGEGRLQEITLEDVESGEQETVPTSALFVYIGAVPPTDWLDGIVALDEKGFILTGDAARAAPSGSWSVKRDPYPLEASIPGVFVAGDVRSGSVKRVGAAVGEGATVIQYIHSYLEDS